MGRPIMSTTGTVIPFGKYRGRTIEDVLAADAKYLEWLAGQDWFRAKHVHLHQVIINRGAEPEETPEHNALQVLFLEDQFCLQVAAAGFDFRAAFEDWRRDALNGKQEQRAKQIKLCQSLEKDIARTGDELAELESGEPKDKRGAMLFSPSRETLKDRVERYRNNLVEAQAELAKLDQSIDELTARRCSLCVRRRNFEVAGIDVVFEIEVNWSKSGQSFAIEIKPSVGDDYPAVLRQMKATYRQGSRQILFLVSYAGTGATEQQFIDTFKSAGIKVVFRRDLVGTSS
jgi:uncharacterized protein (DUF3820 family)